MAQAQSQDTPNNEINVNDLKSFALETKSENNSSRSRNATRKQNRTGSPAIKKFRSRSPLDQSTTSNGNRTARRVYVANIPFECKWTELKDLFRTRIGKVAYCQIFEEDNKSRGCGLVEFLDVASAKKAIEKMNRFIFKGREIVVKEDIDCERDISGRLLLSGNKKDTVTANMNSASMNICQNYNTYGLSSDFLNSLGISGPLNNRIFVANLDYKVSESKLEEIFRLAGRVLRVRLYTDTSGTSKGHGTVEYDHPVEAVQAISMFRNRMLYGRPMSIRMDKYDCDEICEELPTTLPAGLESIGKGLGLNGQPLNVSKSLMNGLITFPTQYDANTIPPLAATTVSYSTTGVSSYGPMGDYASNVANASYLSPTTPYTPTQYTTPQYVPTAYTATPAPLTSPVVPNQLSQNVTNSIIDPHSNVSNTATSGPHASYSTVQSLNTQSTHTNAYNSYYEREFRDDKYRTGQTNLSAITNVPDSTGTNPMPPTTAVSQSTNTILIRNLPASFTWQNLVDRFGEIGTMRYSDFQGRGVAFVQYASCRDAQKAVNIMHGVRIDNRPIDVTYYY